MLGLLVAVASIGSFVCFILVVIKQFQYGGPVQGIIGVVTCGIWTFIWGWMNAGKFSLQKTMMIWTALVIAYAAVVGLFVAAGGFHPTMTP